MSTRREWLASVVISDQFRADNIGATGLNPMDLTPNLDQMAARGVLFRSAYCNQPVCAPARGGIFTGRYPARHAVWHNGPGLPEGTTTLATVARQAGYSANYVGKWHLAPQGGSNAPTPSSGLRRHTKATSTTMTASRSTGPGSIGPTSWRIVPGNSCARHVSRFCHKTAVARRVWEIRVDSVLKLDRAAKRGNSDQNHEEVPR
jgi:arylsulfatase A-like enzyme